MTTAHAVARAVARDAETRARTALEAVLAAHTQLADADTAIAAAAAVKAAAGPQLARAIDTALATGITTEQLVDLGITVPSSRTRRRAAHTRSTPPPPSGPHDAQPVLPAAATPLGPSWPPDQAADGHTPRADAANPEHAPWPPPNP